MSELVKNLEFVLADSYVLYVKVQNFHWNVTGSAFPMWHVFFENLYKELAETIDILAERIRQLGSSVNGGLRSFLANKSLEEARGDETEQEMVICLAHDYKKLGQLIREAISIAQANSDIVTEDHLITYLAACDKAHWMLKSSAEAA